MIEIGGRTLLSRMIEQLRAHVDTIHVVIGYREELLIEYCALHHRDVVLVRNPDFRVTNTAYSYALGARRLRGKTVFLDADLMVTPDSLRRFFEKAAQNDMLLALARAETENAVFVETRGEAERLTVTRFTRTERQPYEWGNILSASSDSMDDAKGYVFEHLERRLPLAACVVESCEVDTAADLKAAEAFAAKNGL
jgi:choline kinase